jgi:hypothetical protein
LLGKGRQRNRYESARHKATQGATYRLERTQSLSAPNWQKVSDLTPITTGQTQITDTSGPVSLGTAFYRVRLLP